MGRRPPFIALAAAVLVACSSGEAAAPPSPVSTVSVGTLPNEPQTVETTSPPDTTTEDTEPSTTEEPTTTRPATRRTTTTVAERPSTATVGRRADGNRLLMIGDSILAATAERYTGEMCARLVPMGWAVEVDAETGRDIDFAMTVLEERLDDGWDAAVIFLGNNYAGPAQYFEQRLTEVLDELSPRPVLLINVTEYERRQAEVNYVIDSVSRRRDDVRVLDWAALTSQDDRLLTGDGLHPSDEGRLALVDLVAEALGRAPRSGDDPECLPTEFDDDRN